MALRLVERLSTEAGGRVWQVVGDESQLVAYVLESPEGYYCRRIGGPRSGPHQTAEAALDSLE
jgi:hypothetical protein